MELRTVERAMAEMDMKRERGRERSRVKGYSSLLKLESYIKSNKYITIHTYIYVYISISHIHISLPLSLSPSLPLSLSIYLLSAPPIQTHSEDFSWQAAAPQGQSELDRGPHTLSMYVYSPAITGQFCPLL